jgi:hypothetical protein
MLSPEQYATIRERHLAVKLAAKRFSEDVRFYCSKESQLTVRTGELEGALQRVEWELERERELDRRQAAFGAHA